MALSSSGTDTQSASYLYSTLIGSTNAPRNADDTARFSVRESVLQAGVNFTCLRGFLPKNTNLEASAGNDLDFDVRFSLIKSPSPIGDLGGDTVLELTSLTTSSSINDRTSAPLSRCSSCSTLYGSTCPLLEDGSLQNEKKKHSLRPTTPGQNVTTTNTDNFLTESDLQYTTLFTFIERSIDLINYQLDKKNDSVTVPLDHYADMSDSLKYIGADRKEMSREDLEDITCFCDKALTQVRQLKDCLLVNFMQLDSILEAYGRAYHEDRQMVAEFRALKRQFMHKLIGQLEQCQKSVQEHNKYLEARLSVVNWNNLINTQHQCSTLFCVVHFIVFLLGMGTLAWYTGYKDRYVGLFYLYRGPMFVTLYFYLYGINLMVWATAKIRYIDIFCFSSVEETPTPYVIFKIAGILSLTFAIFVSMLMITVELENVKTEKSETEIPERILPLLLWIIVAFVLFNPFKWLIHKGRWGVIKVTMRILLAPFFKVRFGDFWFAVQLNSIIVILLDLEFMLCFYSYVWPFDKNEDGKECNRNSYLVRPIISCLPAFLRLLQCLRCYYDTRHYPHLINAGKYLTTFPVVILFALYAADNESLTKRLGEEIRKNPYLAAWIASSFINATCKFIWDVYMDWGLLRSKNLLRPKLGYAWKSFYYLAIIEDFILRFAWPLKISLGLHLQAQDNLFYTFLAGLEIFHRFVWNFYRVEFEHVKAISQLPSNEGSDDDEYDANDNISSL